MNQVIEKMHNALKNVILGNELGTSIAEAIREIERLEMLVAEKEKPVAVGRAKYNAFEGVERKSFVKLDIERLTAKNEVLSEVLKLNEAQLAELKDTAIIDGMKSDCMGEFSFKKEEHIYDEISRVEVNIPWDVIKEIYKKMHESKLRLLGAKGVKERLMNTTIIDKEIERLKAENEKLKGAMNADDERLRKAGERVGVVAGCDNPDWMADKIISLRARVAELEDTAIIDGMRDDCWKNWGEEVSFKSENHIYDNETESYADISVRVNVPWEPMVEIYKKMHESKLRLIAAKGNSDGK